MRIARISTKTKPEAGDMVDLSLLDDLIKKYKNKKGNVIPLLQGTQSIYGYLPHQAIIKLSEATGLSLSNMFGVATFYAQFYLTPRGRKTVRVCRGTACHVRGGALILEAVERELGIKDGETTPDLEYSLETVACIGACALAPAMVVDEDTYGKITPSEAAKVISRKKNKE